MDAPGYVLDQARLRPHEPQRPNQGFIYLTITKIQDARVGAQGLLLG